jgi:hypothetical protein
VANVKNYSDYNGQTVQLVGYLNGMKNADFAIKFPGVKGIRHDGYSMRVGYSAGSREPLPVTRSVIYKTNPSKHVCDARCIGATGKTMNCECSCGGANHGKGFKCE